ncbi:MAG TPA: glutamate-1-semialdehyde 2,1-aminomutase [Syntrophales bacterium]|nr:glutamate-1-semialdehyde 2,1-aminomutase [Syntrophales bacterium]
MSPESSEALFDRARQCIPGGVNSPVRACGAVGAAPRFIDRAAGAHLYDADGNAYVDYVGSWGPMMLGHAHPRVTAAIRAAAERGTSYGAPTAAEVEMAELIRAAFPAIEQVRMVSSGTEATMSAIRLARGVTGRERIVKFAGGYHGHGDSLLVKAGSGVATLGIPGSAGIPAALAALTLVLPYNDAGAAEAAFARCGGEIAAIIVEPVAANMGVVTPAPGFLETLRALTRASGALLIFDEVITGFRLTWGGYQALCGIAPDLTCLGKIIGGGLPVGAFGGRAEFMAHLAPAGNVYQAGTLSGNPLAMAAGLATLRILRERRDDYAALDRRTAHLCDEILTLFRQRGRPARINRAGSLFTPFFTDGDVTDYETALKADVAAYARWWRAMLAEGIYLAPSQFEAAFVSFAHTDEDLERTLAACARALDRV